MDDFIAITGADTAAAQKFMSKARNNLEVAIQMFYEQTPTSLTTAAVVPTPATPPSAASSASSSSASSSAAAEAPPAPVLIDTDVAEIGLFRRKSEAALPRGASHNAEQEGEFGVGVPFVGLSVSARVTGVAAEVELRHSFVNSETVPIEAMYKFYQGDCTVTALKITIGEKVITAKIKEKEQAQNTYDDSIASGNTGFLVETESDPLKEEIVKLLVGNLPPKQACEVSLTYITELKYEEGSLIFCLPCTKGLPLSQTLTTSVGDIPPGFTFTGVFSASPPQKLVDISSSNGATSTADGDGNMVVKFFSPQMSDIFTLKLQCTNYNEPISIIEEDDSGSKLVMVSFFPNVISTGEPTKTEVIFLVDRSGSMAGSRMNQAKNALQLFLRSLRSGTAFNIIGFGATHEKLFPRSREYNEETFAIAELHISGMKANLGGTNVLAPIRDILLTPSHDNLPRQIFFMTDGEVENTPEVLSFVKNNSGNTRVFSFGISAEASPYLVNGIAQVTRGRAEFIQSGTRLEPKVMAQLKRAMQPILTKVKIAWGSLPIEKQVPEILPPLFHQDRLTVYGYLRPGDNSSSSCTISAEQGVSVLTSSFNIPLDKSITGHLLHQLAAHARVRELGDVSASKAEILALGLKYNFMTKYTSFVGVKNWESPTEATMELRVVNKQATVKSPPPPSLAAASPYILDSLHRFDSFGAEESYAIDTIGHLEGQRSQISYARSENCKAKKKGGIGISFPSISLPSISLPSFGRSFAAAPPARASGSSARHSDMKYTGLRSLELKAEAPPTSHFSGNAALPPPPPSAEDLFAFPAPPTSDPSPTLSHSSSSAAKSVTPSTATPATRTMYNLVFAQSMNGAWEMTDAIAVQIMKGASRTSLIAKIPKCIQSLPKGESIWATALVLCCLQKDYLMDQVEWELIFDKGSQWLKQILASATLYDAVMGQAKATLNSPNRESWSYGTREDSSPTYPGCEHGDFRESTNFLCLMEGWVRMNGVVSADDYTKPRNGIPRGWKKLYALSLRGNLFAYETTLISSVPFVDIERVVDVASTSELPPAPPFCSPVVRSEVTPRRGETGFCMDEAASGASHQSDAHSTRKGATRDGNWSGRRKLCGGLPCALLDSPTWCDWCWSWLDINSWGSSGAGYASEGVQREWGYRIDLMLRGGQTLKLAALDYSFYLTWVEFFRSTLRKRNIHTVHGGKPADINGISTTPDREEHGGSTGIPAPENEEVSDTRSLSGDSETEPQKHSLKHSDEDCNQASNLDSECTEYTDLVGTSETFNTQTVQSGWMFVNRNGSWKRLLIIVEKARFNLYDAFETYSLDLRGATVQIQAGSHHNCEDKNFNNPVGDPKREQQAMTDLFLVSGDKSASVCIRAPSNADALQWSITLHSQAAFQIDCAYEGFRENVRGWGLPLIYPSSTPMHGMIAKTVDNIRYQSTLQKHSTQGNDHRTVPHSLSAPVRPFIILSMDGGGVRGAILSIVLQQLNEAFPSLIDRVDLFAGASVGGVISILLAMGWPMSAIRSFGDLCGQVAFFEKVSLGLFQAQYSPENVNAIIQECFGSFQLGDAKKHFLVPTCLLNNGKAEPTCFFEGHYMNDIDPEYRTLTAHEAAVRACSAPCFLPAHSNFVDGAVLCNSSAEFAIAYAHSRLGVPFENIYCLSIGTGKDPKFFPHFSNSGPTHNWGLCQWGFKFGSVLDFNEQRCSDLCSLLLGNRFHLVQPILPKCIKLDAFKHTPTIYEAAASLDLTEAKSWLTHLLE
ncbi:hypothetical protein Pelo_11227 [Pelomyxa schiedti]|nr:hypothetical protein Pelo_11227 [Pelomyxa schiedti]